MNGGDAAKREHTSANLSDRRDSLQAADEQGALRSWEVSGDAVEHSQEESLPRVVVMIPCLNEEQTIAKVIRRVPRTLRGVRDVRVVVINDGSHDGTSVVASRAGADKVVHHKTNLGLGRTFRDGLDASLELGADIIVNIDADAQYDPKETPWLIKPILEGEADIVLGNRQIERLSHMPWSRRWGNRLASWMTRRLSGLDVRDTQTGFRAMSREAALRLMLAGRYTYTQEMIIQAAHHGLAVQEIPITFGRRADGDSRLISSVWRYGLRSAGILLKSYRDHNPMRVFTIIGGILLVGGGILGVRVLAHFLATGMVSPFLPSTILAAILGIVGFQVVIFGLLADMLKVQRQLTEDILLRAKRQWIHEHEKE